MNCMSTSPFLFRLFLHTIHLFSVPTYLLALYSLTFIKSNVFTTYRLFLIWHVLENCSLELHSGVLMEPVIHAPFILLRCTGLLSRVGVSSVIQFYLLGFGIEFDAVSVSEMFYFRYKASILNYKHLKFTHFLRFLVWSTRFLALFNVVFLVATFHDAVDFQKEHKSSELASNPTAQFLKCDTVYLVVPFADYVVTAILVCWALQSVVLICSVPGTTVFVYFNVPATASEVTWKVQRHLLQSLVIQATIHFLMLGIPNSMFLYAVLFGYKSESIAYIAFVCLTYHGFASTLAMIVFTKPLRQYLTATFTIRNRARRVSVVSNKRTSVV